MSNKNDKEFNFEESLNAIIKELNKKFGQGTLMLLGATDKVEKTPVIPSGILPLDAALKIGGFPKGRLVEVYGPESGGKTSVMLHLVAKCQEEGGHAAFIDTEHAFSKELAVAYGVKTESLIFAQPNSATECLAIIEKLIDVKVDLIVVDSLASIAEDTLMEASIDDCTARVASLSRTLGPAIKKFSITAANSGTCLVFINQLRSIINGGYGATETTPGGRALKFHASLRIDIRKEKAITGKDGSQIGHIIRAKITKNKLAVPFTTARFQLLYGQKITEESCLADIAVEHGIFERRGAWYWFDGERLGNGIAGVQEALKERPDLADKIKIRLFDNSNLEVEVTQPPTIVCEAP